MGRWVRVLLLGVLVGYLAWLLMEGIHESGHCLATWMCGGKVAGVRWPLAGFSQTLVADNPRPLLEVWAGPLWGSLFPAAIAWFMSGRKIAGWPTARFVAGLCLVANGAYLGAGAVAPVGDAVDLLHLGTPPWLLVAFGLPALAAGLVTWNGLGRHFGLGRQAPAPTAPGIVRTAIALALALAAAITTSHFAPAL